MKRINEILSGIILRELGFIDEASKAKCLGDDHRKTLEVIAKMLKQNPELGDAGEPTGEEAPAATPEELEAALKMVLK